MIFTNNEEVFVKGNGRFVDDIHFPNLLHMTVVRSPYARARINGISGGLNGRELKALRSSVGEGASKAESVLIEPVLAQEYVNYVGQPVAAVFADDRYASEDLLDSVDVDYEPLKPIMTIKDALTSEPMHPLSKSNVLSDTWRGEDFKDPEVPIILEDEFSNRRISTNPIEPRGVIANYENGRLTLWISTQSIFSIKNGISSSLNLSPSSVRVIQADTGGAFGLKGGLYPEYVIASYAAMKYKRPVKWIESRREHLAASSPGRGAQGKMKLFAKKTGEVVGLKGEIMVDSGAYGGGIGQFAPLFIALQLTGPYGIKNAYVRTMGVMTNKPVLGPYRGAGRPEASFFMERMMDLLSDTIGMDPAEVRLKNTTTEPFTSPLGLVIDASRPFYQKAVEELEYKRFSKSDKPGLSFFVLVPAVNPGESARIMVKDGKIKAWLGGNSHGQGHEVFVKKLIHEELGVPEDIVELEYGDTDMLENGVGSWGSRSAIVGGAAIVAAARKLRKQVEEKFKGYSTEVLLSGSFDSYVFEEGKGPLNSFGANLATVSVDKFGNTEVRDCWSYYDVGRALNMDMVRGQIMGGCAQGIGQALYEGLEYTEDGQLLTSSISDAGVPLAHHLPNFVVKVAENPSAYPHGAKGIGESPTIGVPTAVVRAIERTTGKRIRDTPVKAENLI